MMMAGRSAVGLGQTATCKPFATRRCGLVQRRSLGGRVPLKPVAFKEDGKDTLQKKAQVGVEKVVRDAQDAASNVPRPGVPSDFKEAWDQQGKPAAQFNAQVKVPFFVPAFTRRREIFLGRMAMIGFAGICIAEVVQGGLGPLGQLRNELGLSEQTLFNLLTGVVIYNFFGGLGPWSPTWSRANQEDVGKRPDGPPRVFPADLGKLLGFSGWGFSKQNELFGGRMAMLGVAAAVAGEIRSAGLGPIGQVYQWLGREPNLMMGAGILATFWAAAFTLAYLNNNPGEVASGDDIY